MPAQGNYIRVLTKREKDWHAGEPDGQDYWRGKKRFSFKELAGVTFTKIREPVSVFFAHEHSDEVAIAAAMNVTREPKIKEPTFLLRIPAHFLRRHHIEVVPDNEEGETGVGYVDKKHYNLIAPPEAYPPLTSLLMTERCAGLDLVRPVTTPTLVQYYNLFLNLPEGAVSSDSLIKAKRNIARYTEWKLGKKKK